MMTFRFIRSEPWWTRTDTEREPSPFRASWSDTVSTLMHELDHLGTTDVVYIGMDINEERDTEPHNGMLRQGVRPLSPAVALGFSCRHGVLRYACENYHNWQANVRAIALSLRALRAVDRYSVTHDGEQYKGWTALSAPEKPKARSSRVGWAQIMILKWSRLRPDNFGVDWSWRRAIREAQKNTHPDRGGKVADFQCVMEAASILEAKP